jgi:hypothetical protein
MVDHAKQELADAERVARALACYSPGDHVLVELHGYNGRSYFRPARVTEVLPGRVVIARLDKPFGRSKSCVRAGGFPLHKVMSLEPISKD